MPKFDGRSDPKDYFTWELKVEKIFCLHNYSEEKCWELFSNSSNQEQSNIKY
jgi:hypothetical protein